MGFLLQFLATKAIAPILGSIVLLTMGEHPVSLSKPDIVAKGDTIFISTKISNGFPKELLEIIRSGTPVTMRLKVECLSDIYFTHSVQYDIETKIYSIELENREEQETEDEKKMKDLVSKFDHVILHKSEVSRSNKISLRVSLDPVRLAFLDNEEFDLMTLWDYRSPQQTIGVHLDE